MADNCIDVYYKLDRYYLTGNSIDFALNYKDLGGDVTEMTILGKVKRKRNSFEDTKAYRPPYSRRKNGSC